MMMMMMINTIRCKHSIHRYTVSIYICIYSGCTALYCEPVFSHVAADAAVPQSDPVVSHVGFVMLFYIVWRCFLPVVAGVSKFRLKSVSILTLVTDK